MDSDTGRAQVERLAVVETGRRRRRWPEDEKLSIVLESLQAPRQVAATARQYGVSRALVLLGEIEAKLAEHPDVDQTRPRSAPRTMPATAARH
ncbi:MULTISPECIES: transposase [unclassified Bradyrhizobium]|uniref:transposase n=1 Tax=unclassified Bradyrhizobium TaxID=2631580 RepID=UPI0029162BD7|nr:MULTISPECIES: transposase [unclassified Bradyrhizobium]